MGSNPVRVIKKYSNRRLYDTNASRYVNLDEIAALVRGGEELQVLDASNGDDLTRQVLLQVLLELNGGVDLLPPGLLHRMIRHGVEGPMQRVLLRQMAVGLELLDAQIHRMERQFGWLRPDMAPPPNVGNAEPPPDEPNPTPPPSPGQAPAESELDALRDRLAALEGRLKGG
jgi:polyhydroxyalkanoate synthesis repressor PhaR